MVVLPQAGPSADASAYALRAGRSSRVAPVVRRWLHCSAGCSARRSGKSLHRIDR